MTKSFELRKLKDWVALRSPEYRTQDLKELEEIHVFYRKVLDFLNERRFPYLVGGAYALRHYSGIERYTKDLDLFIKPRDCEALLDLLAQQGYETELTFRHWLGKAIAGDHMIIDIIFSSGNGLCTVDEDWFRYSSGVTVLDRPARIVPPEEMIWSKSFILEKDRCDSADIAHIFLSCSDHLDWDRLIARFGRHWHVLLTHIVLFQFIYPREAKNIPDRVVSLLLDRFMEQRRNPPDIKVCQGTLLSRAEYLIDLTQRGCVDARLAPLGAMTTDDVAQTLAAFRETSPVGKNLVELPLASKAAF